MSVRERKLFSHSPIPTISNCHHPFIAINSTRNCQKIIQGNLERKKQQKNARNKMVIIRILISFSFHRFFQKIVWDYRKSIKGKNETFTSKRPFSINFHSVNWEIFELKSSEQEEAVNKQGDSFTSHYGAK